MRGGTIFVGLTVLGLPLPGCYQPTFLDEPAVTVMSPSTDEGPGEGDVTQTETGTSGSGGSMTTAASALATTTIGDMTGSDATSSTTDSPRASRCERFGEISGFEELVARMFTAILADVRINVYFLRKSVDLPGVRKRIAQALADAAGCTGGEPPPDLAQIHGPMRISGVDYDDFVEDSLVAFAVYGDELAPGLTDADRDWFSAVLEGWRASVIGDADTLFHSGGRYPRWLELAKATLAGVAMDDAINGYFEALDERFAHCLARLFTGLAAGPSVYGDEPVLWNGWASCGVLTPANKWYETEVYPEHATTLADFTAFSAHIIAAAQAAEFSLQQQDDIHALVSELCPQVVADPNTCPGNSGVAKLLLMPVEMKKFGVIADNAYDGSVASMECTAEAELKPPFLPHVDRVEVRVGITHQWIGEVTVKLVHAGADGSLGTADDIAVALLDRPGVMFPDDGKDCLYMGDDCGYKADLHGAHPIRFAVEVPPNDDATWHDAESAGQDLMFSQIVCQDDQRCKFLATELSDLHGAAAVGPWQVCVGDSTHSSNPILPLGTFILAEITVGHVKFKP